MKAKAPALEVRPLTPERWPDLEAVFMARGCSVARNCWCMYYRVSGRESGLLSAERGRQNKRAMRKLVEAGPPPGLIGYRDGVPIGWISLGPREHFAKLEKSPVMKPVDDAKVWSVICFVVPSPYRGEGVAKALLDGARAWAKKQGAKILEAYPIDKEGRGDDQNYWFGTRSMFDAAGFEEVARRKPTRPVMRLRLSR
jgi:GNAT superfamily N-acetyltransferase